MGIYHADPDDYLSLVYDIVPRERVRLCRRRDGLGDLADADVVLAFKFPPGPFRRSELLALPRLRWVQLASAGADHIVPFHQSGVTVTRASGIYGGAIAEYVLGLLVHVRWDVPRLLRQQAERQWQRYEVPTLEGLTLGILGAGDVGRCVAARAKKFGMRTLGMCRSRRRPQAGFDEIVGPKALCRVLGESDIVVLTLPLTEETRGAIGAPELAAMKRGSWLVNVSRGGIVREAPLIEALRARHLGGAILDVFESEPLASDSPFWDLPNVLVTPHIASEFAGWSRAVGHLFCTNLRRYLCGEALADVVDPVRGY